MSVSAYCMYLLMCECVLVCECVCAHVCAGLVVCVFACVCVLLLLKLAGWLTVFSSDWVIMSLWPIRILRVIQH